MNQTTGLLVFIAWRNVWRNPLRSVLTVSALAIGLVMVILYATLVEGVSRQMVRFATEVTSGHIQVQRQAFLDDQDVYATLPWAYLDALEQAFPTLSLAPRLYAAGLASHQSFSTGVMMRAVDPLREPGVTMMLSHVRAGEMDLSQVAPSPLPAGPADARWVAAPMYRVVVGAQLAKNLQLVPGGELVLVTQAADGSIGNALFQVAGVLKPLDPAFDRMGVLMSIEAWQALMYLEDGFHELVVKQPDGEEGLARWQARIEQHLDTLIQRDPLDDLGGPVVVRHWRQVQPAVADMLEISHVMLVIIGFIVVSLASLGMLNTMLMSIHERTHEFGILLAIGMKRWALLWMVMLESLCLSLVAVAAGGVLGVWAGLWLERHGIDFSATMPDGFDWAGIVFEPVIQGYVLAEAVALACLFTVVVAMLASLLPAWRIVRMKPAEVI